MMRDTIQAGVGVLNWNQGMIWRCMVGKGGRIYIQLAAARATDIAISCAFSSSELTRYVEGAGTERHCLPQQMLHQEHIALL